MHCLGTCMLLQGCPGEACWSVLLGLALSAALSAGFLVEQCGMQPPC